MELFPHPNCEMGGWGHKTEIWLLSANFRFFVLSIKFMLFMHSIKNFAGFLDCVKHTVSGIQMALSNLESIESNLIKPCVRTQILFANS